MPVESQVQQPNVPSDAVDEHGNHAPRMPTTLGILGGGQLGRMMIQAASTLEIDVVVAELKPWSPAARLAQAEVVFNGGWDDPAGLTELARRASVVTLENEFVDAGVLKRLEGLGVPVLPTPDSVGVVQDKLRQKKALVAAGLPVPPFHVVQEPSDLARIGAELGWPLLLKARREGYDGYGNVLLRGEGDAAVACESLGWPARTLFAEAYVPFERELAMIIVRGQGGELACYPVVETQQDPERHVCRVVLAPANVPSEVAARAVEVARSAVEAVGGVGAFGVELFLLSDGSILVNELAPRPHNSGHYSIEACVTSQFANHVRAVLGLPLGDPSLRAPAAAMVNLLGTGSPMPDRDQLAASLAVPSAYLHLYGKTESRSGRKMGHVTALGESLEQALDRAMQSASRIRI